MNIPSAQLPQTIMLPKASSTLPATHALEKVLLLNRVTKKRRLSSTSSTFSMEDLLPSLPSIASSDADSTFPKLASSLFLSSDVESILESRHDQPDEEDDITNYSKTAVSRKRFRRDCDRGLVRSRTIRSSDKRSARLDTLPLLCFEQCVQNPCISTMTQKNTPAA